MQIKKKSGAIHLYKKNSMSELIVKQILLAVKSLAKIKLFAYITLMTNYFNFYRFYKFYVSDQGSQIYLFVFLAPVIAGTLFQQSSFMEQSSSLGKWA